MAGLVEYRRASTIAENCLAWGANAYTPDDIDSSGAVEAILGGCDAEIQSVLGWAHVPFWSNSQYEPSVSEQIAVRQLELERLERRAAYYVRLNDEAYCRELRRPH